VTVSLRARLTIVSVALVAAGLLIAEVATYQSLSRFLLQRVDEQLLVAEPLAVARLQHGEGFEGGPPPQLSIPSGSYAQLVDASGTVVGSTVIGFTDKGVTPPALPGGLPGSGGPQEGDVTYTASSIDGTYRIKATAVHGGGTLVVGIPLTEMLVTLRRLLVLETLVGATVLVGVALLARWLVRRSLQPLEGIGATAGAIAAGDLTRRVEPADGRTEVGRLGLALNAMLAQIEAAFDERRRSEERLRRFVADASHELRTPLTSIRGYAELFRRGAGSRPEDLAKSMARIEAEASRMGILVDDLLLLARLDQGRPLDRKPVDLARVAGEAVESARAVEPDRPIGLSADGPIELIGDRGRLRQVVDNLLDNVRVHTPAGTPVHVSVSADGAGASLTVADEGAGLEPDAAARLFERFYRGDPARSRETGGAGLGLSIVAAIVESHGGTVRVVPREGGGTILEVRLPRGTA
jgi:two-component system OmpR family sensor kinase